MTTETVEIYYDQTCIFRETDAAWYVYFEFNGTYARNNVGHFMPKSKCELDEKNKIIKMPLWLAQKKGLD